MTGSYFCVHHKNRRKRNQNVKHWQIQLNISMQQIKFTSHKQYLFGRLSSGNPKKTHTDQSILQASFFNLKRNDSQTAKKLLSSLHTIDTNLLRWMLFIPFDNWNSILFVKVCRHFEILSTPILQLSLKQVFWKKSVFYVISTISLWR